LYEGQKDYSCSSLENKGGGYADAFHDDNWYQRRALGTTQPRQVPIAFRPL